MPSTTAKESIAAVPATIRCTSAGLAIPAAGLTPAIAGGVAARPGQDGCDCKTGSATPISTTGRSASTWSRRCNRTIEGGAGVRSLHRTVTRTLVSATAGICGSHHGDATSIHQR